MKVKHMSALYPVRSNANEFIISHYDIMLNAK